VYIQIFLKYRYFNLWFLSFKADEIHYEGTRREEVKKNSDSR
jgi:hypothetical protein